MKNILLIFVLLNLLLACSSAPLNESKNHNSKENTLTSNAKKTDEYYLALQARAEIDDVTLDYSELRQAFTKSSFYQPYGSDERKRVEENFKLFDEEKYDLCLQSANTLLTKNFISLGGHYVSVICAKALDLEETAYLHEEILDGLIDSIKKSGDGQGLESAYVIYTTEELYTFLQLNGLKVKGQGIINEDNKVFESMQVSANDSDQEFTLFFDITTQWQMAFSKLKN